MDENHSILLKPICELTASKEFMEMAAGNHFENLGQIVQIPLYKLDKLPMFGAKMQYDKSCYHVFEGNKKRFQI